MLLLLLLFYLFIIIIIIIVKSRPIECFNRYEPLTQLDYNNETVSTSLNSDVQNDRVNVDVDLVGRKAKAMVRNKQERKLRLATWNFSGLCSDHKQKEIGELLAKHNLDVVYSRAGVLGKRGN